MSIFLIELHDHYFTKRSADNLREFIHSEEYTAIDAPTTVTGFQDSQDLEKCNQLENALLNYTIGSDVLRSSSERPVNRLDKKSEEYRLNQVSNPASQ